jgi:hypothetical protein
MAESDLLMGVLDIAKLHRWRTIHIRPGRTAHGWRSPVQGDGAGFPDILAIRGMRLLVAELKVGRGRLTADQDAWLAAFAAVTDEVYVWREGDYPDAIEVALR